MFGLEKEEEVLWCSLKKMMKVIFVKIIKRQICNYFKISTWCSLRHNWCTFRISLVLVASEIYWALRFCPREKHILAQS